MMPTLADLDPADRAVAAHRWEVLRPHVEGGVTLPAAAAHSGVPCRTPQRWLAQYRKCGLTGLAPRERSDSGKRRLPDDLVHLIEGLALQRPAPAVTTITRAVGDVATRNGWPVPAYSTVRAIVTGLDPHLVTLAHDGPVALRDKYELVYRRGFTTSSTSEAVTMRRARCTSWMGAETAAETGKKSGPHR